MKKQFLLFCTLMSLCAGYSAHAGNMALITNGFHRGLKAGINAGIEGYKASMMIAQGTSNALFNFIKNPFVLTPTILITGAYTISGICNTFYEKLPEDSWSRTIAQRTGLLAKKTWALGKDISEKAYEATIQPLRKYYYVIVLEKTMNDIQAISKIYCKDKSGKIVKNEFIMDGSVPQEVKDRLAQKIDYAKTILNTDESLVGAELRNIILDAQSFSSPCEKLQQKIDYRKFLD
ncbi:MAG: hypothetical protein JW725_02375 [Candidatus Babeliaceae bacterium]|nr:hypothetical protein [Candidatus Babeliaceae bacterium]